MAFNIELQNILLCSTFAVTFLWRITRIHARSKKTVPRPPKPVGDLPFIGHLHLLGANKILHQLFGAMADKYGPIFSLQLGIHKTVMISSWEVARECFTIQDKVFPSRPRSLAIKIMGCDHAVLGFMPYGPNWRDRRKIVTSELLSNRRLDMLRHVRESEVSLFTRDLYEQMDKQRRWRHGRCGTK